MKIAIASGKGGTGKTTVALALALANRHRTRLVDCDVEEPNAHLFLQGPVIATKDVMARIPAIDPALCDLCGACVRFCRYNALAMAGKAGPMLFPELCHDCGGCARICPKGAISEKPVLRGILETRLIGGDLELLTGRLEVGSPSAPTVIRAAIEAEPTIPAPTTILDAPPGTACSFAACVGRADHCLFVTDPTPFGLHDLELAMEAARGLSIPYSVVVNRSRSADDMAETFCREHGLRIALRIPDDRSFAETYARGGTLIDWRPELAESFQGVLDHILQGAAE